MEDWELGGLVVNGQFWADTRLCFGAKSSPSIFLRYSDLFQWILQNEFDIQYTCHYADDHLVVCAPHGKALPRCSAQEISERVAQAAKMLGIKISVGKSLGPSTVMLYLGIELDTVLMQARISKERKEKVLQELRRVCSASVVTLKQLESLLGRLIFVSYVVQPGRSFVSRIIALITLGVRKRLNAFTPQ